MIIRIMHVLKHLRIETLKPLFTEILEMRVNDTSKLTLLWCFRFIQLDICAL